MQHHVHVIVFKILITGNDEKNAQQYNTMTQSEIQTQVETVWLTTLSGFPLICRTKRILFNDFNFSIPTNQISYGLLYQFSSSFSLAMFLNQQQ